MINKTDKSTERRAAAGRIDPAPINNTAAAALAFARSIVSVDTSKTMPASTTSVKFASA